MAEEKINVVFTIQGGTREKFMKWLQANSELADQYTSGIIGMRAGDDVERRAALITFVDAMEHKLRKNDHKTGWRLLPVDALFRFLMLEIEEFRIAHDYLPVKESRLELVDVANYALILYDRLSMLDQEQTHAVNDKLEKVTK